MGHQLGGRSEGGEGGTKIVGNLQKLGWLSGCFGQFLGGSWAAWGYLSPSWAILGHLGVIFGHLETVLGPSGAILRPSWSHLEAILRCLEPFLGILGPASAILRPSWSQLGATWQE